MHTLNLKKILLIFRVTFKTSIKLKYQLDLKCQINPYTLQVNLSVK